MYGFTLLPSLLLSFISYSRPSHGLRQTQDLSLPSINTPRRVSYGGIKANPIQWPPVPFQVPLLRRRGQQSIVITRNTRRNYGPDALDLAKKVCARMTTWITTLPHGTPIDEPHWEKESYGEVHAREFTIWMQLVPKDTSGPVKLDRELAYFAMNEYCNLVAVYGAMRGEFEFWGFDTVLAVTVIYIMQWPKSKAAGSSA
ncbi:MAG: hypothetical protein Q9173_004416 [Seirophora scorigena]